MRERYMVANWKMNVPSKGISGFFDDFFDLVMSSQCHVWIAPELVHYPQIPTDSFLKWGAQDCSEHLQGAYTGEVSPCALKDVGASFVIVGHSERRNYHLEKGNLLKNKVLSALEVGLKIIFCVGEQLDHRKQGRAEEVIRDQLDELFTDMDMNTKEKVCNQLLIAYEPVWAIGTGVTATPKEAQEIHAKIRAYLGKSLGVKGESISILYGGSVKPANVEALLACQDIDGGLVGGASLDGKSFAELCLACF